MVEITPGTQIGADGRRYPAGEQPTDAAPYATTLVRVNGDLAEGEVPVWDEETGTFVPGAGGGGGGVSDAHIRSVVEGRLAEAPGTDYDTPEQIAAAFDYYDGLIAGLSGGGGVDEPPADTTPIVLVDGVGMMSAGETWQKQQVGGLTGIEPGDWVIGSVSARDRGWNDAPAGWQVLATHAGPDSAPGLPGIAIGKAGLNGDDAYHQFNLADSNRGVAVAALRGAQSARIQDMVQSLQDHDLAWDPGAALDVVSTFDGPTVDMPADGMCVIAINMNTGNNNHSPVITPPSGITRMAGSVDGDAPDSYAAAHAMGRATSHLFMVALTAGTHDLGVEFGHFTVDCAAGGNPQARTFAIYPSVTAAYGFNPWHLILDLSLESIKGWVSGGGTWAADVDHIEQTDVGSGPYWLYWQPELYADETYAEVEIMFPTDGGGNQYGGLMFGNASNAGITARLQRVAVWRANLENTSVADLSNVLWGNKFGDWHKVGLLITGAGAAMYVDGVKVATAVVSQNTPRHYLALWAYTSEVHFRNLKVFEHAALRPPDLTAFGVFPPN